MADKKISQLTAASTPVAGTEVFPIVQSGSTVKATIDNLFDRQSNYLSVLGANRATTTYGNLHVASTSNAAAYNGGTLSFGGKSVATGNQYVFGGFKFMSDPASGTGWDTYATMSLTNADSSVSEKISFKNNGDLTALSGNVVIGTAGKGIDFSAATHAAGMTSELLNDYEEGTFTATLTGSSTAPTTPVTATAYYTKIGRLVTCNILFSSVDTTGASGAILISGLPFTPALIRSVGACNMGGMGAIAAVSTVSSGNTTMEIWDATQVNNILIIPGAGKTVNTTISYLV